MINKILPIGTTVHWALFELELGGRSNTYTVIFFAGEIIDWELKANGELYYRVDFNNHRIEKVGAWEVYPSRDELISGLQKYLPQFKVIPEFEKDYLNLLKKYNAYLMKSLVCDTSSFSVRVIFNVEGVEEALPEVLAYTFAYKIHADHPLDSMFRLRKEAWLNAPAESEVNNAGAKGIIIEDRGLYKMMAFEESYIDLKNPISIEQRNTSPAEDALKAALQDMCELWESIGKQIPPLLNEQKYLNARNLVGNATDVPAKESEGNNGEK